MTTDEERLVVQLEILRLTKYCVAEVLYRTRRTEAQAIYTLEILGIL